MKVNRPPISFADERGEIIDILVREGVEHATLITSRAGAVRGNHYHKATIQYNYILHGRVKLLTQLPGENVVATILETGDFAVTQPMESHSLTALEDSTILVLTRGPRGGRDYEKDTFRLEEPLREGEAPSPVR